MPQSAYPTGADLEVRLTAAKIASLPAGSLDLFRDAGVFDIAASAAAAEWEALIGCGDGGYLAAANPSTRNFDPPVSAGAYSAPRIGTRLPLVPALRSLSSLSVGGSPLRAGSAFALRPNNAPNAGRSYQWIDFLSPLTTAEPGSIAITGRWGVVDAIPDDVWQALVQLAQSAIAPDLGLAISGGLLERKIGDSIKRFAGTGSDGPMDLQARLWKSAFDRIVQREQRVTF